MTALRLYGASRGSSARRVIVYPVVDLRSSPDHRSETGWTGLSMFPVATTRELYPRTRDAHVTKGS